MARLRQQHDDDDEGGASCSSTTEIRSLLRQQQLRSPPSQERDQRGIRRRRKLGQISDNALLGPWAGDKTNNGSARTVLNRNPIKPQTEASVALRSRARRHATSTRYDHSESLEEVGDSASQDDIDEQSSEYCSPCSSEIYDTEDDSFDFLPSPKTSYSSKKYGTTTRPGTKAKERTKTSDRGRSTSQETLQGISEHQDGTRSARQHLSQPCHEGTSAQDLDEPSDVFFSADENLPGHSSSPARPTEEHDISERSRPITPRKDSAVAARRLVSPTKKLPRIPNTPHRPSMDVFWDQDQVDGWNLEHSPRKLFQPMAQEDQPRCSPGKKTAAKRHMKASFNSAKHRIADEFLQELDDRITGGKLRDLAGPTGGVKITWSNRLNTTAGRANWKRETVRNRAGGGGGDAEVHQRHHASIELAEKVIDDENRLLNVIAHEFCHLANFMVSGVTANPHGKEFKVWAQKCSRAFADRGIQVTTKHSYEIDFKYTWECTACGTEFKRHSKSIDPARHRCGSCKSLLKQTKPVPRGAGKPTEYQAFVKEQMKIVKAENPASPQKEILKVVASRWNEAAKAKRTAPPSVSIDNITSTLADLVIDKTS